VNRELQTPKPEPELDEHTLGLLEKARSANPDDQVSIVDGKLVISGKFERRDGRRREPRPKKSTPAKIAQLLMLAHRVEAAVRSGKLRSHHEAALRLGMSQSRLSRIIKLTFLAPDIQEAILALEVVNGVEPPVTERLLRPLAAMRSWAKQREGWRQSRRASDCLD
jgi:hypothetical protein